MKRAGQSSCQPVPLVSHPQWKALVQHHQNGKNVRNLPVRAEKISPGALPLNVPELLLPQRDFRSRLVPAQQPELISSPVTPVLPSSFPGNDTLSPTKRQQCKVVQPVLSRPAVTLGQSSQAVGHPMVSLPRLLVTLGSVCPGCWSPCGQSAQAIGHPVVRPQGRQCQACTLLTSQRLTPASVSSG